MKNTLLISLDDILTYTQISGVVDEFKINPHIYNAQILYLEPILGSTLYEKLIDLVNTGNITGATYVKYKELLDTYVSPSLVFHTAELFIPLNAFNISNAGVSQFSPQNVAYSPMNEIDKLSNKYKIIGMKYDDKLHLYLCKNSADFTEYTNSNGLVGKTENSARAGIYLGNSRGGSKIRF